MPIVIIDGFKIYDSPQRKSLIIESDRIKESMQFFQKNNLDGIAVTSSFGLNDLSFVKDYPFIKHLSISEGAFDIKDIYSLENLTSLIISGKKQKIDYVYFPKLKELIADWSPYFTNLDKCYCLERLSFYKYAPSSKNLEVIAGINWLKSLTITQSPISSLKGLEQFTQLEQIELNYCSKLEELCCLEGSSETLITLLLDHCKAIKNHDYAMGLKNVKILAYNNCGKIPSIKFIKQMPSLKDFRFVGTNVSDGDISPCIGLKYVGFFNKKHYSHTSEQISSLSIA
ncbi:hypothetical protein [Mucilaginibacter sp.]|jgi:hypothetical protein|uniref:hypothetical protein n=1 Tax=Mucilaginibacter sp. TaxID=1882438 RepID=UPI003561F722